MDRRRFDDLLDRHIDGALSDPEQEELDDIVRTSPELREELLDILEIHRSLEQRWSEDADAASIMRKILGASAAPAGRSQPMSRRSPQHGGWISRASRFARPRPALLALSAVLMAAVGLAAWRSGAFASAPVETPIARITVAGDDLTIIRHEQKIDASLGMALFPGDQLERTPASGAWRAAPTIRYDDGTSIDLGSDTSVRLGHEHGKRIALARGDVHVVAAHQAAEAPLVVATAMADAVVVGTTLAVEVHARTTTLRVAEGRVRLISSSGEALVGAGEESVADDHAAPSAPRPFAPATFAPWRTAPPPNLLVNPGFEDGLNGWQHPGSGRNDASPVSGPVRSGRQSLKVEPSLESEIYQDFAIDTGATYEISCWAKATGMANRKARATFRIYWFDARGRQLRMDATTSAVDDADWTLLTGSFPAPPFAAKLRCEMHAVDPDHAMTAWFDDCELRRISE